MKKTLIILSVLVLVSVACYGQRLVIKADTLVIHKTFSDRNGNNNLEIKVINPCRENKYDGGINYIITRFSLV